MNVGFEQNGNGDEYVRPVVIVAKYGEHTCLVVPLTHTIRPAWYRHVMRVSDETVAALINQTRVVDKRRLQERMGVVGSEEFSVLKNKIIALMKR